MKTLKIEIIDGDSRETFEMPMKFDTLNDDTLEDVEWDLSEVSEEKLEEMRWWLIDRGDDADPRDLLVYWAELLHRQSKRQPTKFTQFAQDLAAGRIKLNDEQQRLAKRITDKLKPDTNIGKGSTLMHEIKKDEPPR